MILAGTDEAGRGCLIGSLVLCLTSIDSSKEESLRALGVKDSKLLSPAQRTKIAVILPKYVNYSLAIIAPEEIDRYVFSPTTNLNWLEADQTIFLLDNHKEKVNKVIVDCPSPNLLAYKNYLQKSLPEDIEVVTEHKADVNHLVVGAASILAKVKRDLIIENIKKEIGVDFGSGYPSDPKTQAFLRDYWDEYSDIFRKSWSTYQNVAKQKNSC